MAYFENKALASANLILQPPENVFVARDCISGVNPKPLRIMDARAGALSASMFSNCAYTSVNSADRFGSVELKKIYYFHVILFSWKVIQVTLITKKLLHYLYIQFCSCLTINNLETSFQFKNC